MDHKERGVALVINMQKYDPAPDQRKQLEERVWSLKDAENLKNTLEYLEFDFKLLQDLRGEQIRSNMQALAKYVDFTNSDCFLCVVMSHGNHEKIIACDNKEISYEDLMEPIKSCKSLINKPKLFFFQSCRGCNQMETITNSSSSKTSTQQSKRSNDNSTEKTTNTSLIEYKSDLFIFYSTLPNHLSFALPDFKEGTCFVKCVCDVFKEAYKNLPNNLSLSQMVTRIKEKVKEAGMKSGERLQLTDPRTTLTKELYFMPKNVNHEFILTIKIRLSTVLCPFFTRSQIILKTIPNKQSTLFYKMSCFIRIYYEKKVISPIDFLSDRNFPKTILRHFLDKKAQNT